MIGFSKAERLAMKLRTRCLRELNTDKNSGVGNTFFKVDQIDRTLLGPSRSNLNDEAWEFIVQEVRIGRYANKAIWRGHVVVYPDLTVIFDPYGWSEAREGKNAVPAELEKILSCAFGGPDR